MAERLAAATNLDADWRTCSACAAFKPPECFYLVGSRRPGELQSICKECLGVARRARYKANRAKALTEAWEQNLRRKYGIGIEDYELMLDKQNYACAICLRHQDEFPKKLCVDHCHESGRVRGLLCHICNSTLGYWRDEPSVAFAAGDYLAAAAEEIAG